ncbi:MAG: ABC transporter permease subunit, partial [Arenicellales bacterium]
MIQSAPTTPNLLLRLWRNQESRGVIIQILTMVALFAFMAAIARNVVINLEAVGKEFSFGFLLWPAAYDIGFSPFLEYTNKSTHLRAAVVGLLNTLLVAFWGCILATMLGFVLGIMRLSSNWLVSKISYVYVEFMRNVPILIHILAIYSIVVTLLPSAKKAINVGADAFFLSNRGFYVPSPVFEDGAGFVGVVILISIGLVFFFKRWARRIQDHTGKIYP